MRNLLIASALALLLVAGCAHSVATGTEEAVKLTKITGSRIAKAGSARSRGVLVIPVQELHQQGTPSTGEALKKSTPIVR
jgi:hypothetical protein